MPKKAQYKLQGLRSQQGFSLLELSIVLIIAGILLVPAIQAYVQYKQNRDLRTTDAALSVVGAALSQYFIDFGVLPCPANPTLPTTNANHGAEDCAAGWVNSTANGADFDGNGNPDDYDGSGFEDDFIIIGAVPYATLQIPISDAKDAYGSKLGYAVSASMTPAGPGAVATTWGAIRVQTVDVDNTGTIVFSDEIDVGVDNDGSGRPDNDEVIPFGVPDSGLFHAIAYSHGPDRKGAYSIEGIGPNACNAANGRDAENCDADALFYSSYPFENPGANYFDDNVVFNLWSFGGLWSIDPGNTNNIVNNNPGNVGINTANPQERLHVAGNVIVNQMQSDFVCDQGVVSGTGVVTCFQPVAISGDNAVAGEGMACAPDQVMVGITNGGPDCQNVALVPGALYGSSCPPGEFIVGITSTGGLDCDVP